jgi:hypothetical protein
MTRKEPDEILKDWNERKPHVVCIFLGEPTPEFIVSGHITHVDNSGITVVNARARFYLGFSKSRQPKVICPNEIPAPIQKYAQSWVCGIETGVGSSELFLLEFSGDTPLSTLENPSG